MPMHDWKPVRVNRYHHFHQQWSSRLCDGLNAGVLPKGYFALVEQRTPPFEPDILALSSRHRPRKKRSEEGGLALADTPPQTRVVSQQGEASAYAQAANQLGVRDPDGELVAILEIVSPGNKHSDQAMRDFVRKTTAFIDKGIHVLMVDPFPPTPRDPQGLHKVVWDVFEEEPFDLPAGKPLTAASYKATDVRTAYVENFGIGDVVPSAPLFISPRRYVLAPLEEFYVAAWTAAPEEFKEMVEKVQGKRNAGSRRNGKH